ncbi:methyl-accepting chemotaxis transmembrane protein [Candidatus Magnetomorum sp. HK-1]|nr:methyl-accepting chemotaxis transmembrane protein [Candidatus Magnetomorum sp. HK-1]
MAQKIKRRFQNFLINERMQLTLTFQFLILSVLFTIFIGMLMFFVIWPVVKVYIPPALVSVMIQQLVSKLYSTSFILLLVIAGFSIIFTHRIAGPVYHLERTLDRLLDDDDDVNLIHLRDGDELQGLASKINQVILFMKQSNKETQNAVGLL